MVIVYILDYLHAFDHVNINERHPSQFVRPDSVFLQKLPIDSSPAALENRLPYWPDEVIAFSEADKFFRDEKFPSIKQDRIFNTSSY